MSEEVLPERYLRIFIANKVGNPQYEGAKKFADLIAAKTKGKLGIKIYQSSAIGKDTEVLKSMQLGGADMAVMNTNLLVGVAKEAGLIDLPYLFDNEKEAYAVLDGPVGKKIHAALEPKGVIGLSFFDMGYYHFHNNTRPITRLEDLQGLKMRVTETPVSIETVAALGGKPEPIPYPELYFALKENKVDGAGQPLINLVSAKFYETQKYLTLTRHTYTPQSLLINTRIWASLSAEEQKAFKEAASEATAYQRQVSQEKTAQSLTFLKTKMAVNEMSAAEVARMRERVQPVVARFSKEYGESLAKEMFAEIAKVRKSKP